MSYDQNINIGFQSVIDIMSSSMTIIAVFYSKSDLQPLLFIRYPYLVYSCQNKILLHTSLSRFIDTEHMCHQFCCVVQKMRHSNHDLRK